MNQVFFKVLEQEISYFVLLFKDFVQMVKIDFENRGRGNYGGVAMVVLSEKLKFSREITLKKLTWE